MFNHPCFEQKISHLYGRVHLPVAPDCHIQCNFCNRQYTCVNESRPGVTSVILTPEQTIYYLKDVLEKKPNITVAGIAGPGEPFANPSATMRTLRLIRENFPQLILCVASNGLNILPYVEKLKELQVSHVTITINAIEPSIAAKIYAWVRAGKKVERGVEAARLLIERQLEAVARLKEQNFTVKVNTIIVPGINDGHIVAVAKKIAELKVDVLNCISLFPSPDTVFANLKEPTPEMMAGIRKQAEQYLPQMHHCQRCRADAVGLLDEKLTAEGIFQLPQASRLSVEGKNRDCVAVGSREGLLINQHLGEAMEFWLFRRTEEGFRFLERRVAPERGGGVRRWLDLSKVLSDCHTILVSNAGHIPREILALKGIQVIETAGIITDVLNAIAQGTSVDSLPKNEMSGCGSGCSGGGQGCG